MPVPYRRLLFTFVFWTIGVTVLTTVFPLDQPSVWPDDFLSNLPASLIGGVISTFYTWWVDDTMEKKNERWKARKQREKEKK